MRAKADNREHPTIADFSIEQSKYVFCDQMNYLVGTQNGLFTFESSDFLVGQTLLEESMQESVQVSLHTTVLYFAHYSTLAAHPGERQMYDLQRCEYYWLNMADDVRITVKCCTDCPRIGTIFHHQRKLDVVPPSGPLEFVETDIHRPLPRYRFRQPICGHHYWKVQELTRALPSTTITSSEMENIFYNHRVIPYGITATILSDNGQQFLSKFFTSMSACQGITRLTPTTYYVQTIEQVTRHK